MHVLELLQLGFPLCLFGPPALHVSLKLCLFGTLTLTAALTDRLLHLAFGKLCSLTLLLDALILKFDPFLTGRK